MASDVERQVVGLGEGPVTVGARIRTGPGVHAHVAYEAVVAGECFSTNAANARFIPGVRALMVRQIQRPWESLITHITLKRPFPRMPPHMHHVIIITGKPSPTQRTEVRLLRRNIVPFRLVRSHVKLQIVLAVKLPVALLALKLLLRRHMAANVPLEVVRLGEAFVADGAKEPLAGVVSGVCGIRVGMVRGGVLFQARLPHELFVVAQGAEELFRGVGALGSEVAVQDGGVWEGLLAVLAREEVFWGVGGGGVVQEELLAGEALVADEAGVDALDEVFRVGVGVGEGEFFAVEFGDLVETLHVPGVDLLYQVVEIVVGDVAFGEEEGF